MVEEFHLKSSQHRQIRRAGEWDDSLLHSTNSRKVIVLGTATSKTGLDPKQLFFKRRNRRGQTCNSKQNVETRTGEVHTNQSYRRNSETEIEITSSVRIGQRWTWNRALNIY